MAEQTQSPDILKNVAGVLMFFPPFGIPVFFASVGFKIAGILINTAGSVVGAVTGQLSNIFSGICCSGSSCKPVS
jgi:hypothetical protein